jgi:hypothetical protein
MTPKRLHWTTFQWMLARVRAPNSVTVLQVFLMWLCGCYLEGGAIVRCVWALCRCTEWPWHWHQHQQHYRLRFIGRCFGREALPWRLLD